MKTELIDTENRLAVARERAYEASEMGKVVKRYTFLVVK